MVIVSHTKLGLSQPLDPFAPINYLLRFGGHGVEIFFVISGFLITKLLLKEVAVTGSFSLSRFYLRRFFRIVPPFYLFLAVAAIATGFGFSRLRPADFLVSALFTTNYFYSSPSDWLGHTWSLSIEEQFYLLWPAALLLLGPKRGGRLALWIIVCSPLIRVACYFLFPAMRPRGPVLFHMRADALMWGCAAALYFDHPRFRRLCAIAFRPPLLIAAAILLFVLSPPLAVVFRATYLFTIGYTLHGLSITVLLLWLVLNPHSAAGRLMNWKPVVHIGQISYSLYLWQQVFLLQNNHVTGTFPLNLVSTLLLAEASYRWVEKPSQSFGRRLGGSTTSPENVCTLERSQ